MGLLDTVADVASGVADVAPIPGSDLVSSGIDAVQGAFGGGGDGGGGQSQPQGRMRTTGGTGGAAPMPSPPTLGGGSRSPSGRGQRSTDRDTIGIQSGGSLNLPGLPSVGGEFGITSPAPSGPGGGGGQQQGGQQQGGQMAQSGNFMQMFVADMLDEAVTGANSRAILEAMQAGSLQGGMIQQPTRVETPRGTEFHSQPGFRTVTLNGQKVSVFKPIAKALNLLPSGERTFRQKADDAAREYLTMRNRWKKLASKFGFKAPKSRKSGPKR